jgi:hypothetical protein
MYIYRERETINKDRYLGGFVALEHPAPRTNMIGSVLVLEGVILWVEKY